MNRYRKLIVAAAGAAVLIVGRHFGVDSDLYFDVTVLATVAGVGRIPNAPADIEQP